MRGSAVMLGGLVAGAVVLIAGGVIVLTSLGNATKAAADARDGTATGEGEFVSFRQYVDLIDGMAGEIAPPPAEAVPAVPAPPASPVPPEEPPEAEPEAPEALVGLEGQDGAEEERAPREHLPRKRPVQRPGVSPEQPPGDTLSRDRRR